MNHDGEPDSYEYAFRLATWIWEKHYKNESPHWKPLNDLLGVLTQIDNMVTGLVRAQPEQEHSEQWWRHEVSNAYANGYEKGRASVKQPEQEPVAWADKYDIELDGHDFWVSRQQPAKNGVPLYTAPPQREWQGLTEYEVGFLTVFDGLYDVEVPLLANFIRHIEAKLKEKNT